ncbi:MAG: hypothetical protein OJF59_002694 [Cytophagales bacterium]|jgi:hypothetical protein|nr:MAG: hypothetical protein OJF59_002694 [Cytophagales bacterium]
MAHSKRCAIFYFKKCKIFFEAVFVNLTRLDEVREVGPWV